MVLGAALAGAGLVAYSLLSWGLMAKAPDRAWTVLALFGPLLAALALAGWQRRHGPTLAGCAALAVVLVVVWQRGGVDLKGLYVLQHAAAHAVLAWMFGITLRPGATPLITAIAARVHRQPLTPALHAYTRRLTRGWVVFFVAMIAVSLVLVVVAPWGWWSFFCTVLTPGAAVAGFVGEHVWRRIAHPEFERVTLHTAWQAWRHHGREPV